MTKEPSSAVFTEEHEISQKLIEAALAGDEETVSAAISSELVDVNYKGTINLRVKHTDSLQREEVADQVTIEYEEFKTDVTALFAAAHAGHVNITKRLLLAGADVNEKLFRGYATTAAAREGHGRILDMLQRSGASQLALEDALLEACLYGEVEAAVLLISSEMTRPEVLAQAVVHASNRGFVDVVETLIKSGVDINSWHRMLLRSAKPALHANIDCTPLVAAIIGRHTTVVKYLLEAGAKTGCQVSIGAWSWDYGPGEEIRVGAGLAEPYNEAWCAVEYWETKGEILRMLLDYLSPNDEQNGRTLLCHAILCRNDAAVQILISAGVDIDHRMRTKNGQVFYAVHMTAKAGYISTLNLLISHGCNLNVQTELGETALMLSAKGGYQDCFRELLLAGADLGLLNQDGHNVIKVAEDAGHGKFIANIIRDALRSGYKLYSSNPHAFVPLHFAAKDGDVKVLKHLLQRSDIDLNAQDQYGYTAAMVAAQAGHVDAFKMLVLAGADISLKNKKGETALCVSKYGGILEYVERILLDAILSNTLKGESFKALHFAAWRGSVDSLAQLLKQGYPINSWDQEEYTPLMLSAKEGHAEACKLLLAAGADCNLANSRGETALTLARKSTSSKAAEGVILDHVAMKLVLLGGRLYKHTRQGKGAPHVKVVRMLRSGILTWGDGSRRNVLCKEAGLGPTNTFRKNRKGDADRPGVFRIMAFNGREVYFEAPALSNAELWVRGINVIVREAAKSNGNIR